MQTSMMSLAREALMALLLTRRSLLHPQVAHIQEAQRQPADHLATMASHALFIHFFQGR